MPFRAADYYIWKLNTYIDVGYTFEQAENLARKAAAATNQRMIREEEARKKSEQAKTQAQTQENAQA